MTLTKEQQQELLEASRPLLKWINDNCHPHCTINITQDTVELVETVSRVPCSEYVKG